MDLEQFSGVAKKFNEGIWIDIKHPVTNQSTGFEILVCSYLSDKAKEVKRRMIDSEVREQKKNPRRVVPAEEFEKKAIDLIASVILNWRGLQKEGKDIECTYDNIKEILNNPDLYFVAEQIDKAADDNTLFFTK